MHSFTRLGSAVTALVLLAPIDASAAEEATLFNGKNLDGWTFHLQGDDQEKVEDPWIVQRGLLISRGLATGYLIHKDEFENYVLTLELRTMSTDEGNGMAVGSLGSVFINAVAEEAEFGGAPKSIEISLRESGCVYFRDIDQDTFFHHNEKWVHRAPDFADDAERDMGEWNDVKVISSGKRLTVFFNGRVVNQIEPINRTKGAVALKTSRGFIAAPTFYRNITIRPIGPADLEEEKNASSEFARVKVAIAKRNAAEEAHRAEEERKQAEAEQKEAEVQQRLAKEWTEVPVAQDVEFTADVRRLPYPANAQEIQFRSVFNTVEFESPSSLAALSKFYRTEMPARGWQVTDTDIEDDEVTVTFQHGESEVELNLDESSDGVDVSLDCEELSFDGTDNPAELVKMGVPQPKAYLVLQRELKLPESYRDQEYDMGERRLFKSTLKLPELYGFLTQQLRRKGYRETRRPILSEDRRYSEFSHGRVEISVNAFAHEIGSRVVLTYEEH